MSTDDYPLPNLADGMKAQQDAVSVMMNMAAESEGKLNKLMAISDKLYLAHSSLQDVATSFNTSFRKAQIIYTALLVGGIAACVLAVGSVLYAAHLSAQTAKEHQVVLEGLKSEYAATSKSLKDEVDRLQESLVEKYRAALGRLETARDQTEQNIKKSYDESLRSLSAEHELEIQALKRSFDLRAKEMEEQVELAKAKQQAAESREMAVRKSMNK